MPKYAKRNRVVQDPNERSFYGGKVIRTRHPKHAQRCRAVRMGRNPTYTWTSKCRTIRQEGDLR